MSKIELQDLNENFELKSGFILGMSMYEVVEQCQQLCKDNNIEIKIVGDVIEDHDIIITKQGNQSWNRTMYLVNGKFLQVREALDNLIEFWGSADLDLAPPSHYNEGYFALYIDAQSCVLITGYNFKDPSKYKLLKVVLGETVVIEIDTLDDISKLDKIKTNWHWLEKVKKEYQKRKDEFNVLEK